MKKRSGLAHLKKEQPRPNTHFPKLIVPQCQVGGVRIIGEIFQNIGLYLGIGCFMQILIAVKGQILKKYSGHTGLNQERVIVAFYNTYEFLSLGRPISFYGVKRSKSGFDDFGERHNFSNQQNRLVEALPFPRIEKQHKLKYGFAGRLEM